jgi:hypothetical protein
MSNMSCKSSKAVFNPETTEKVYLTFGSGGGFTGKVIKYYMLEDGTIYTKSGDEIIKLGKATKQMSTQVFANYESLGLHKINLNEPGNKYSFIERSNEGEKNAIMWGKSSLDNSNVETYFSILMNIVKKVKPSETL